MAARGAWAAVCEAEAAAALDSRDFCSTAVVRSSSPIDDYYGYVEHLLTFGDEDALAASETLGRLLLLGLVSGVEAYFRSVLAEVVRICPVARHAASDQLIPFGAIDYYGHGAVERGLFDSGSLAGASEIMARTRKLTGLEIQRNSSAEAALLEFDKVCHFRHAAVHARGELGRGNAIALGLRRDPDGWVLELSLAGLHQAGAACHSAVRAYNRYLYRRTVERWIGEAQFVGTWQRDKSLFRPLFELFASRRDEIAPSNAYLAYRNLPGMQR